MFHCIIWLTLILSTLQNSPADKAIDHLQAGTFVLQEIENAQNHLFMWQFETPFQINPQLTFAINKLEASNENSLSSYNVVPQAVTKTGVMFSSKRDTKKWIAIHLNYLATTRKDLIFGHQQIKIEKEPSAIAEVTINPPLKSLKTTIARMYLTGCSVGGSLFDCGVSGKALTASTLTVAVYANQQNSTLKDLFVSFSYILFSPSEAKFSSYGGMVDKEKFVGVDSQSIHSTIYQSQYFLFGFSKLTFETQNEQIIGADIDSDMILSFEAKQAVKFRFLYIIIGKSSTEACPDEESPYQWDGFCIKKCPNSTYSYEYQNGGKSCLRCSEKLYQELSNDTCICKESFQMIKGKCQKKEQEKVKAVSLEAEKMEEKNENPATQLFDLYKNMKKKLSEDLDVLPQNETQLTEQQGKNQEREMQQEKEAIKETKTKREKISSHEINKDVKPEQNNIERSDKLKEKNQQTVIYPSYMDSNLKTDHQKVTKSNQQPPVQENPTLLPTFINQEQQTYTSHVPSSCGPHAYFLENICLCSPGYTRIQEQCILSTSDFTPLPVYVDTVPSLHHQNNSHGCHIPQCSPPSFLGPNNQCICPSHFVMYKGNCISCPSPGLFDYSEGKCLKLCKENEIFDPILQKCKCIQGFGFGKDGECTLCEGGFLFKGYCVQCPQNRVFDQGCKKCICPNGTLQDALGQCLGRCGSNEYFNTQIGSCMCDQGFGRINGRCSLCPQGQVVDENGICSPCKTNQEVIDGKCICLKGFILRNNKCIPCSKFPNAFLFGEICSECSPGYQLVSGQCKCKPSFTIYNNECLPCNQVPDAYLIDGICIKCSPGTVIQDGQCVDPGISALNKNEEIQKKRVVSLGKPSVCGNGLVQDQEECDDRNQIDGDGCSSSCKVEQGFSCKRMPSRCQSSNFSSQNQTKQSNKTSQNPEGNSPTKENINKNQNNGKELTQKSGLLESSASKSTQKGNLWLQGDIIGNSNQIFIVLNTKTAFEFQSQSQMQKFIKAQFKGIRPPTVFFSQRPAPNKQLFDCLLIFPSGVPNSMFTINFSYQKDSKKGETSVEVDPLAIAVPTRSRRRNRDRA